MKKTLTIVVGFLHDLATGCWGATVLSVWMLHREAILPTSPPILQDLMRRFFWVGLACVAVVLLTGAGRTFTYVGNVYGEADEAKRRRMLIAKHIILAIIFGGGIAWQYIMVY